MIQTLVKLETFTEFTFTKEMLNISRQEYEDYLSKYLAIARGQRVQVDKVSILSDVDFCLELIHIFFYLVLILFQTHLMHAGRFIPDGQKK